VEKTGIMMSYRIIMFIKAIILFNKRLEKLIQMGENKPTLQLAVTCNQFGTDKDNEG
jgi:hypothetical protein